MMKRRHVGRGAHVDLPTPERPDLGSCCGCGTRQGVRSVVMLDRKAPDGSSGWGCFVCELPAEGAIAVLCDPCSEAKPQRIEFLVVGYPMEDRRVPIDEVPMRAHAHNMAKHGDETYGGLLPH